MKTKHLGIRISEELFLRLLAAIKKNRYALTLTQVTERGLELALRELERKK